jgi:hypothetical protein
MQIDGTLNKLTTVRALLDVISLSLCIFFFLLFVGTYHMIDRVRAHFTGKSKLEARDTCKKS